MEEDLGILLQEQEQIVMEKHISFSYPVMEKLYHSVESSSSLEIFKSIWMVICKQDYRWNFAPVGSSTW